MFNGNPNILISTPEIKSFALGDGIEWFILACNFF